MVIIIILAILVIANIALLISSFDDGGVIFMVSAGIFAGLLILVIFFTDPPKEAATNLIKSTDEMKLASIQGENSDESYVLRNSEGEYYFITEVEDQFGKGHSGYKEKVIDGSEVFIFEDESNTNGAYVRIDEYDAKCSAMSSGFRNVKAYTFVVPKGTIKYVQELPIIE